MNETDGINKPRELLEVILADLDRLRSTILYTDSDEIPKKINAIYDSGTINLKGAYVKEIIGKDERLIRKEWRKKGFILTIPNDKRDTVQITKKGQYHRALMINPSILNEIGYDFSDQNAEPQGNVLRFPFKKGDLK